MTLTEKLAEKLEAGKLRIGQILVTTAPQDGWDLRHVDDAGRERAQLETFSGWEQARDLARYSDSGEYRYLKGGNDLRHGWRLELASVADVRAALDAFYPAALGLALAGAARRVVPLRETLERQTGMYRYARTISDDGVALIRRDRCERQCLRQILWPVGREDAMPESESPEPGTIPLLCSEACNFLVADARKVAKREFEAKQATSS